MRSSYIIFEKHVVSKMSTSQITFEQYAVSKMSISRLNFKKSCVSKMRACGLTFKKSVHFKYKYISFSNLSLFVSEQFWRHHVLENKHFWLINKKPRSNNAHTMISWWFHRPIKLNFFGEFAVLYLV